MKRIGLVLCGMLLSATAAFAELRPDQVAIIAMGESPESRDLAIYYAKARGVPLTQICMLEGKLDDVLPRSTWEQKVRPAILQWLKNQGLSTKIRCLVTVWDVPLKIGYLDGKSPVIVARKVYLQQARVSKVRQIESILKAIESVGAGPTATEKPALAPEASADQLSADFGNAMVHAQQRLRLLPAAEQKRAETMMERIMALAGGNNGMMQVFTAAPKTDATPDRSMQVAMFSGRNQGLQFGLQALNALPESIVRDEQIIEVTEAVGGPFSAIRWIDQQLSQINANASRASFDSELAQLYA